ncbi:HTH-type transcriptional activator RhaR [wastewater metagenome]|uniref:HTH-type transcriptional activator RhaR n=2 Tax=unclassified sequences TaxID=12908 RepID=A0A5B8RDA3_9ZZZZ|nr:AraC family transcriptional regulator [Arhodomonas sp. KWT]QEA05464.1 HTH-type transcriptional activator RhaR [uncultured organism]
MTVPTEPAHLALRRYARETHHHAHPHHQVVLPLAGTLEMDVDGRGGDVTGDCAAVIPRGRPHGFAGSGDNAFLILDITAPPSPGNGREFWQAAAEQPFVRFDASLHGLCRFMAERIGPDGLGGVRSEVTGSMIVETLARGLDTVPAALPRPLARAVRFMESHCSEALTVAAIAREAGVGTSRLFTLFDTHFGTSPGRYLARQRLHHARWLLETTRRPLAEIALASGYADQSTFTRAFRRETGMPPAAYRRRHGGRR